MTLEGLVETQEEKKFQLADVLFGDWKDSKLYQKVLDLVMINAGWERASLYNIITGNTPMNPLQGIRIIVHDAIHYLAAQMQHIEHSEILLNDRSYGAVGRFLERINPQAFHVSDQTYGFDAFVNYVGTSVQHLIATAAPLVAEMTAGNIMIQASRGIKNRYLRKAVASYGLILEMEPALNIFSNTDPTQTDIYKVMDMISQYAMNTPLGHQITSMLHMSQEKIGVVPAALGAAAVSLVVLYAVNCTTDFAIRAYHRKGADAQPSGTLS